MIFYFLIMNFFTYLKGNSTIVDGKKYTYSEFLDIADTIGGHVGKRSLVFLVCSNSIESVAGYVGCMRAGAVVALIDNNIDNSLMKKLFDQYKPSYVYTGDKEADTYKYEKKHTWNDYTLLKTDYHIDYALHEDLALLLTTSGSTGTPKLVRQSYQNIFCNAEAIASYLAITPEDRAITTMPMSYTYGLSIINSHLLRGASLILTEASLMQKRFWQIMAEEKVTTFGGVPYIYEMLKRLRFHRMDFPHLRYITQAGGRLSRKLIDEFIEICSEKGIEFIVMYGQTEATARIAYVPWEYARDKSGGIGIAIPGGRLWLEDKEGRVIEDSDVPGELVYQGNNVMLGYAAGCHDLVKGDELNGILHTGDLARKDDDGFYTVIGRKNRFLKLFGKRIHLDEVEQLLSCASLDCVCSGVDDKMKIYLTRDIQDDVQRFIVNKLKIHPSGFSIVRIEEIPRKVSGKVDYRKL